MDFEKLGLFYLGREADAQTRRVTDKPLLYDANDLVTHAAIIGMTGSGKTGLGIGLIEEAAIDGIPVLAIDPKGDLGNLLLTFPDLAAADFAPWVNPEEGRRQGIGDGELAAAEAARWSKGLADWGQQGARIARLRAAADFALYTPGSTAGRALSIVKSFAPPPAAILDDEELLGERVATAATSLLALAGIESEPMRSREHVLIATLLQTAWRHGQTLDLGALIAAIQTPPFARIGVIDLESFYPSSDRFQLAIRLNHLIAAPGFATWLQGEPLDIGTLLYSPAGKPRVSIISIAHLDNHERMFFVALLLNELVGWTRAQRGTSSLRAMVYFDEVLGFLPPVSNPPSKPPLLTMLKQARAFGVGLVLATQNPVDLDYKALSNMGTWFLGRLQTERDKARLLDGLEGAGGIGGKGLDRASLDQMLSSLEKRMFLLHDIHEDAPVLFQTRWTMSYLRGPMGREEIARIARVADVPRVGDAEGSGGAGRSGLSTVARPEFMGGEADRSGWEALPIPDLPHLPHQTDSPYQAREAPSTSAPVLDPGVPQYFVSGDGGVWTPSIVGAVRINYSDAKLRVDEVRDIVVTTPIGDGPVPVDWELAEPAPFTLQELQKAPGSARPFAPLPAGATQPRRYAQWEKELARWAAQSQSVDLLRSERAGLVSHPDEQERDFRIRVQETLREARDAAVAKMRQKYAAKLASAEDRVRRAEATVAREQEEASESKLQAGVSVFATIAGAFLGRKAISASTLGRATTAARGMGRVGRQAQDVARAEAGVTALREQRDAVAADLERELQTVAAGFDGSTDVFDRILLKPKRGGVAVQLVALLWSARA